MLLKDANIYYPGATIISSVRRLSLYTDAVGGYKYTPDAITNENVDGDQSYGDCMGFLRRSKSGSHWNNSTHAGSRSIYAIYLSARDDNVNAIRGCST